MRRGLLPFTALLFVMGTLGTNLGPALVDERPLLTLVLSARIRNLIGAVPFVDPLTFFSVGFVRLLVAAVTLHAVGRTWGASALAWTESRIGEMPAVYRATERLARRVGWLAILLMPGSNLVCLLLGHLGMPARRFAGLASAGIVVRLSVLWWGGKSVESEIETAVAWVNRYQWWVVGGLFAVTFLQSARRRPSPAPFGEDTEST